MKINVISGAVGVISVDVAGLRDMRNGSRRISHRDRIMIEERIGIEYGSRVSEQAKASWMRIVR